MNAFDVQCSQRCVQAVSEEVESGKEEAFARYATELVTGEWDSVPYPRLTRKTVYHEIASPKEPS